MEAVNHRVFSSMAELRKKPAHLAVFIQYILSSRCDPSPLVCYCVCECVLIITVTQDCCNSVVDTAAYTSKPGLILTGSSCQCQVEHPSPI